MDIRLSRTDLDGLLRLIDSVHGPRLQMASSGGAGQRQDCSRAAIDGPLSGSNSGSHPATLLDAFGCYFDRGIAAAGDGSGSAGSLTQAQLYGTSEALTNALRVWTTDNEGNAQRSAYMLASTRGDAGGTELPTFDQVRDNIRQMTGGGPKLREELDKLGQSGVRHLQLADSDVVAGDGVVTGSPSLAINAIWLANHNNWVMQLRHDTDGAWTEDEYFEAARVINTAEYQRVVFNEFADAVAARSGGAGSDWQLAPRAVPFTETVAITDAAGRSQSVSLANMFLGTASSDIIVPGGVAALDAPAPSSTARGDEDLAARLVQLTAVRDEDARGPRPASLNQIKAELFVLTGLASMRPYGSWSDFQSRNNLTDDVIRDLQAAYPEGVNAIDAWFGGLAEHPAEGQLGATFSVLARIALEHQSAREPLLVDHLEGLPLKDAIEEKSFADIVSRVTGLEDLPSDILLAGVGILQALDDTDGSGIIVHGTDLGEMIFGTSGSDILYGNGGDDILIGDSRFRDVLESGEDAVGELEALLDGLGVLPESGGSTPADTMAAEPARDTVAVQSPVADAQAVVPAVVPDAVREASVPASDAVSDVAGELAAAEAGGEPEASENSVAVDPVVKSEAADQTAVPPAHAGDLLDGGEGDDILIGGILGDILIGGLGDDVLAGGDGADIADGGEGDDLLAGGAGNDELRGGEGYDAVYGGSGDDAMFGGEGADELFGGSGSDEIWGDAADDRDDEEALVLTDTFGNDDVIGSSAADMLSTGSGTDIVFAGSGTDIISTGSGQDLVDGGDHDDWIDGGSGNDTLSGGQGKDSIFGGSGDDKLYGGSGDDKLFGGSGKDWLEGGSGANLYDGGSGDDWITSVSGRDTIVLQPGFGNDTVAGFDPASYGSGGQNRIDVSAYGFDKDSFGTDILVLTIGDDTVIKIGADTLTLLSVNAQTIDRNDFIFS
jgi:Ca2+-binding RTX toxin-like protein